jgi:hypothetical protein
MPQQRNSKAYLIIPKMTHENVFRFQTQIRHNKWGSSKCILHNILTTDQNFCFSQILKKEWEYEAVHQLFIDFKKAYYLVRWEVLYNILKYWYAHEINQAN